MKVNILASLPLLSMAVPSVAADNTERPNFLFILLDDLAYDAIESTGRYPFLETPNITRLQESGVTLNNYFCTISLSSPSRACLMTGMYPHVHGVTQNDRAVDADWEKYPPYSSYLQAAGYQTAFIGKMHQALLWGEDQVRPGFDYWLGFRGQGAYYENILNENGKEFYKEGYITDVLTEYAEDWITEKRDPSRPFSMCLWHKAVHGPFTAAERHLGCYQDESLPMPPNGNGEDTFENKPEWQKEKKKHYRIWENDPKWNPHFKEPLDILETLRAVDESIGRMLDLLEKEGLLENTVVLFSSDNGYFMGEHGFWDKRIAYDECMRIPMVIRYPEGFGNGRTVDELCLTIDIAPTILDMAGAEVPAHMQGRSIYPLLKGDKVRDWRKSFLFEYYVDDAYPYAGPTMVAVRTERYKLVDCLDESEMDELYDLENDPGEMVNLINSSEHSGILRKMYREERHLIKETGYHADRDFWLRQCAPEWEKKNLDKLKKEKANQMSHE